MTRNAKPSPSLSSAAAAGGDAATFSPSAARDDAVALLRLAGLDHAELANALKWGEAEVPAMSHERRRKTVRLAEERDAALALRLLYDRGGTERDLMPATLRPVTIARP